MSRLAACLCALVLPGAAAAEAPNLAGHVTAEVQPLSGAAEPLAIDALLAHHAVFGAPVGASVQVHLSRLSRVIVLETALRHLGGTPWSVAADVSDELGIFGNVVDLRRDNVRARVELELAQTLAGTLEWRLGTSELVPITMTSVLFAARAVVHSLALGLRWDTRDDPARPTGGNLLAARVEAAPALGLFERELPLLRAELGFEDHRALTSRVLVHGRANAGRISAHSRGFPAEAYFEGGPGFVRGTRPHSVSAALAIPRTFTTIATGGDAMASGSMELELRFANRWRALAFFDVGEVFIGGFPAGDSPATGALSGGAECHVDLPGNFELTSTLAAVRLQGASSPFLSVGLTGHIGR